MPMKNIIFANIRAALACPIFMLSLLISLNAQAQDNEIKSAQENVSPQENNEGLWDSFTNNIAETWNTPQQQDLFLPVLTRHNRHTHSKKQIEGYNDKEDTIIDMLKSFLLKQYLTIIH